VESIFLDESEDIATDNLERIKALGIDIEIDDFGTGHTSIVSLLKLKPKRLKIDRQLVQPIVTSPQERALVSSIIDIARSLGVETVAEGVETLGACQPAAMNSAATCCRATPSRVPSPSTTSRRSRHRDGMADGVLGRETVLDLRKQRFRNVTIWRKESVCPRGFWPMSVAPFQRMARRPAAARQTRSGRNICRTIHSVTFSA
jgi:hypothetical protein